MTFIPSEAKRKYLASDEAAWVAEQLQQLVDDNRYNTLDQPSYANPDMPPTSFVQWNLIYLCEHPQISAADYLSNVRLKTKIRVSR